MKQDKIKFIKNGIVFIGIFSILTALVVALPSYIFFKGKEYYSIDKVIELQNNQNESFLYGKAYSDEQSLYKLKLVNSQDCDVIALGTSRVMQFRSHFFNKSFCNAGGGVYNIKDFKAFLEHIDKKNKPKLLIIGLDQYFFHERWTDNQQNFVERNKISILSASIFRIYNDFLKKKIDLDKIKLSSSYRIGINAIIKENGFRNDGSYFYAETIQKNDSVENKTKDTLYWIDNSKGRFIQNVSFSKNSENDIDLLLKYCYDNNIKVIGLLPPFAKEAWTKIKDKKGSYEYMFMIEERIKPIFKEYDYEFYDFSDMNDLDASNCEIIDGFHASEKTYLRLLISIGKNSSILKKYIDLEYLKRKLEISKGCFLTIEKLE